MNEFFLGIVSGIICNSIFIVFLSYLSKKLLSINTKPIITYTVGSFLYGIIHMFIGSNYTLFGEYYTGMFDALFFSSLLFGIFYFFIPYIEKNITNMS